MADDTIESLQAELAGARARLTEVNNEAKGHRLNYENEKKAAEAHRKALDDAFKAHAEALKTHTDAVAAAEKKAADAMTAAAQRAVNADLKVAANTAGANDVADVLALLPRDQIKLNEAGEITNAAELMTALKASKPYLFGATSTSSAAKPPGDKPPAPKLATEMTDEEWRTARAAAIRA